MGETSLDVLTCLAAGLKVCQFVFSREGFCLFFGDFPLCFQVSLVSNKDNLGLRMSQVFEVMNPVCDVIECLFVGQVEHQEASCFALKILLDGASEPRVTSCVPHLDLDVCSVNVDHLVGKLDPDCWVGSPFVE